MSGPQAGSSSGLARVLGTGLLTVLVVGDILGAGIYILVGEVAAEVGGRLWLPFLLAMVLAAVTGASYAELAARYPHAAGSAHWVDVAYSRPLLTFLVGFVVACSAISTGAAVARAVGGRYLSVLIELPDVAVAVGTIVALSLLAWFGLAESARANAAMTAVEVGGLLLVVAAGVFGFLDGSADTSSLLGSAGPDAGWNAIVAATALAFFAYLGFEDAVHLAEEVRNPARAFPRALLGGLVVVGSLYLAVAVSAAVLVDPQRLSTSSKPLLDALDQGPLPVPAEVFAVIAIVAVTNTALLALTTASRQLYGLAEQGSVPSVFARVGTRHTECSDRGRGLVTAGLAATGGVRELADTTVVLLLAVFAIVNATVVVLRRRTAVDPGTGASHPSDDRGDSGGGSGFRTPLVLPFIGVVACSGLLVHTLLNSGAGLFVRLGVLLGLGGLLFLLGRRAGPMNEPVSAR
ncbi:MAG: APC family permease [Microthrixaceae bacterium]